MAEIDAQPSALAKEMALTVHGLFVEGGSLLSARDPEVCMLRVTPLQQGVLIAAIALRRVLASSAEGRQALRDLGFEPVFDDVQGE